MQIGRLFEIVYILMNKKNITARELCEHFEVSQRTIYRDIETLCQSGIPIYTTKGKGGGIALMENFVLNKSVLSEREQNDILSALTGFKATANSDTDQVLNKLNALFGNKRTDWIEVDFSNWNSKEEDKHKFNLLKDAILNRNIITFHYYNSNGQESNRNLEPHKLLFRGQAWYLYGYCNDKKDYRYFKITRIRELQVTEDKFKGLPPALKAKDNVPATVAYPTLQVTLIIDVEMGYRVFDEFLQEDILQNPDGSFLIHTTMQGGNWLTGYLMSYEDHIEILEPATLRDEILLKYKNAITKYQLQ